VCISPWNFPLAIFMGQVTAALAAGNSVIAKPAEQTNLVASFAIKLLHEAGRARRRGAAAAGRWRQRRRRADRGPAHRRRGRSPARPRPAWAINKALANRRGPLAVLIAETGGQNALIATPRPCPSNWSRTR
jgi:RHH-type proline utilization regulon transcriptional repressor/proline dehydrogenase/delta 1-pyrroline-5-carboxylate dehydrogenase